MMRTVKLIGIVLFFPSLGMAQEPVIISNSVKTLKDVFTHALKNSEKIAISAQSVLQAEALYKQTMGSSFPEFSYRHQTLWQDKFGAEHDGMLRVSKTNLTGYRELAAVKAGRTVIRQKEYERLRVEQLLLGDVAGAYFSLLQLTENVSATKRLIELAEKRLVELRDRERVGRTRQTDSIGQEYQITSLRSQLEESVRLVNAVGDLLAYLAGVPVAEPEGSNILVPSEDLTLDDLLPRTEQRPDVLAAQESLKISEAFTKIARANYLPSLDWAANLFIYSPEPGNDPRWNTSFNINFPLWDWGAKRGALDASKASYNQTKEALRAARRQADLEVRNAFRDYVSAKKQMEFRSKAVELARKDYELQVRDDRKGLVTSLEVLESMNRLNNAELAFSQARLQERLSSINLEIALGAKPEEILK